MKKTVFMLPEKIESLQALRFFGAMCITLYHFTGLQGACPFNFSNAVYLFYMISGFVVMLSTREPEKKRFFLTRRLLRTIPLYWGLTVLTFAAGLFFPSFLGYKPTLPQLCKSLFLIPFERTTAKAGTAIRPLVGLGHTLQMEMLFYLFFFFAMRLNHKKRGVLAVVFAGATALAGVCFPTKNPVIHFYTANYYVWSSFIIGVLLYGVFSFVQKKSPTVHAQAVPACVTAVAAALFLPALFCPTSVWYDIFAFAVIFCSGLVWSACGKKTPRLAVKLGNISYSYYLLHYYTVSLGARFFGIGFFSLPNVCIAVLISAVTWGISWVSWYLVEHRLNAFLLRRLPPNAAVRRNA